MNDKKKKKNIEQWLKHIKKGTNRGITCEKAKKTKQESVLGFLGNGMHTYIGCIRAQAYSETLAQKCKKHKK